MALEAACCATNPVGLIFLVPLSYTPPRQRPIPHHTRLLLLTSDDIPQSLCRPMLRLASISASSIRLVCIRMYVCTYVRTSLIININHAYRRPEEPFWHFPYL